MAKKMSNIAVLFLIIMACKNTVAKEKILKSNANESILATEELKSIIGTWRIVGMCFTLDGKTEPTGNWEYKTTKQIADEKNEGFDADDTNFTFKANGKGYIGKNDMEEMSFTYKKLPNGKYTFKLFGDEEPKNTNAENVELFYFDSKGQLIYHHSSKPLIMGKYVIQNSFELCKKK